jgi:hypothetical protein
VFWCSSSGDTLGSAHFGSSSHCIVFLATLGTMCHLSLGGVGKHSVCLFYWSVHDLLLSVYKILLFLFVAMLLIGHNLHHN